MTPEMRESLRAAGARAGRQSRRSCGTDDYVTDAVKVHRLAELLRRAGERT